MSTCDICNKQFSSGHALAAHRKYHFQQNHQIYCSCIYTKKQLLASHLMKYQKQLTPCGRCGTLFKPSCRKSVTACSRSCSTALANRRRGQRSEETKQKISKGLRITTKRVRKPNAYTRIKFTDIGGPYTSLFYCRCKHCSVRWYSRTRLKYCRDHVQLYSSESRAMYKFTFNVYHYPNLFDLNKLKEIGWFAPGGKAGRWNINGLSRDHKISINDAILNGYDPFYIKHPLNCELIPHSVNNSKKTNSSITYEELVKSVDEFEFWLQRLDSNQ